MSAPSGSGKSTLVAGWHDRQAAAAWLQVDQADRDAAWFWAQVVAALAQSHEIGPDVVGQVARAADNPEPLIDGLINALVGIEPTTLVIDDYHLVSSPTIDRSIERLIDLAPAGLTVVLLTRWNPALRLAHLRVAGRLAEVRANDLRFAEDEAAHLLRAEAAEYTYDNDHVRMLCERTEGAAGLVLARLSIDSTADVAAFVESFRGDDRLVVDYLTDEFLAHAEDAELRRLIQTSILDEMSGPLVDAVCGTSESAAWLADLAARNQLMIGLGRSREWYRYHHLLRDVLRLEAQTETSTDELHRRAGAWHRPGALAHAVLARIEEGAADAIGHARRVPESAAASAQPLSAAYAVASAGDALCTHGVDDEGARLVQQAKVLASRCPDPGIVGRYVARVEARHALADATATASGHVEELTDRELAVLRYLPSPMSQRDIASELFVSLNTVKSHCRAIYRKLAVTDRKAAVQAARDAGLL